MQPPRRRFLTYSFLGLLNVVLWAALFLGGWTAHRWKVAADEARVADAAKRARAAAASTSQTVVIYSLGKHVSADATPQECSRVAAQIVAQMVAEVAPSTWLGRGGDGQVTEFPASQSLVIRQTQPVHERIRAWLERFNPKE